jgi:shikimate kinase
MNQLRTQRLYLTGFMGSGKSTLGPILANTLGYSFLDLDRAIETRTGKSIPEIFREYGEDYFRSTEQSILEATSGSHKYVIALGGGTITNNHNFDFVKSRGILIYLQSSVSDILRRLRNKTDRPLFTILRQQATSSDDLRTLVTSLLKQREYYYNQADIIIATSYQPIGRTIDEISRRLHLLYKI